MNPEQIKREQERVKGLLDKAAPEPWEIGSFRRYAVFSLHPDASRRPVVTVRHFEGDNEPMDGEAQANLQLCAAAPSLARAYAALLDAHLALHAQLAQAGEREKALREERDAYRKGLTTLINVHVNAPSAGDMRDVWERNAWKHAESIVTQYGCESCVGLTFEDGIIACWTCGRVLPDAQAGEG